MPDATTLTDLSYYPLDDIRLEFLKYAPHYAQAEAKEALDRLQELQMQGLIRSGIYYIVLVDLVGSTKFGVENGNDALTKRVQTFVKASFDALNAIKLQNIGLFLKEIGDAVLYVFCHFPDIVNWLHEFRLLLSCFGGNHPIVVRTCIHAGEVSLDGVNPVAIAVSQVFKMEKEVKGGDVVLTSVAYHCAWPSIARAHHGFEPYGEINLIGIDTTVPLHQLMIHDGEDLKRIASEDLADQ